MTRDASRSAFIDQPTARREARDYMTHFAVANERLERAWTWKDALFRFSDSFDCPLKAPGPGSHASLERILDAVLRGTLAPGGKRKRRLSNVR